MDRYDKEFETYLRQFRLRQPGPPAEVASLRRRSSMRWVLAAAVVVLVIGLSAVLLRKPTSGAGPKATIEAAGTPSVYRVGEIIEGGRIVRSNSAQGLVLALEDGSRIEMRTESELKLESAADGIRVRLNAGIILVKAAKQGAGHLYVETRDATVSVVGTVFLVNAEQAGTIVSVVEGEVHVQQGAKLTKLLSGEQAATNSAMPVKPVAEEIAWSRSAAEYVAMLQQPAVESTTQTAEPIGTSQAVDPPQVNSVPSLSLLPFKVLASYIRVTSDEVRTLITIQFMNRDLAFQDVATGKTARAHIEGEIYRIDNRKLAGFSQDVLVEFPSNSFAANLNQPTLFQETRYLTPGKYKAHITVTDQNSQSLGVMDYMLNVPRIPDQTLQGSSMILAYSIADTPAGRVGVDPFAVGNKTVKPNVSGEFRRDQSLNVWQEVYGLSPDPNSGRPVATFELTISQSGQEIRKFTSSSMEPLESGLRRTYTNSIPLGDIAPGPYDVQLKVTDNLAKASFVTLSRFKVAAPSAQSEPPRISSGKQIFDRECTSCHSADVAMQMERHGAPLSSADRESLSRRRSELAQLKSRGLKSVHPDVVRLQSVIDELESREIGVEGNYRNFISRHLTGTGRVPSAAEGSILSAYLVEATASRLETQGNTAPPVQPNDNDGKKEDPDVAGARILNSACTTCHDLGAAIGRTEDRAGWDRIVNGMIGYGANVKDAELPVLVDYLFKKYGPPKNSPGPVEPIPFPIDRPRP